MAQKRFKAEYENVFDLNLRETKQFEIFYLLNDSRKMFGASGLYLKELWKESLTRKYHYNDNLIEEKEFNSQITIERSRLIDDYYDLMERYQVPDKKFHELLESSKENLLPHPLFTIKQIKRRGHHEN